MEFVKEYPVEKLRVWDKNPRKNDEAAEKLKGIIMEYGFVNPIVIDQNGVIRAGHTRLKAALSLKRAHVPVLIYDFKDEAQAIGYAIADNKTSEWAEWDFEKLEEIMKELEETDFDIDMTGFDESDFEKNFSDEKDDHFKELQEHDVDEIETKPIWLSVRASPCDKEILDEVKKTLEEKDIRVVTSYAE